MKISPKFGFATLFEADRIESNYRQQLTRGKATQDFSAFQRSLSDQAELVRGTAAYKQLSLQTDRYLQLNAVSAQAFYHCPDPVDEKSLIQATGISFEPTQDEVLVELNYRRRRLPIGEVQMDRPSDYRTWLLIPVEQLKEQLEPILNKMVGFKANLKTLKQLTGPDQRPKLPFPAQLNQWIRKIPPNPAMQKPLLDRHHFANLEA